jgi:hypothetical protein
VAETKYLLCDAMMKNCQSAFFTTAMMVSQMFGHLGLSEPIRVIVIPAQFSVCACGDSGEIGSQRSQLESHYL